MEIDVSLPTPNSVQKLQRTLQAKAKSEPGFRFYTLWDKICRMDVLDAAYRHCRANGGAPGADGTSFEAIEDHGVSGWLGNLQEELVAKKYRPGPLLRVWIPKGNGGQRPLGIPTIRDRVVQMAMQLVLGPIFEADLPPQQYGFRPKIDAKAAVRRAYYHVTQYGRREVVDGDLSDYFNTIPHGPLLKCVARRVTDGQVLAVLKAWLRAAVVERVKRGFKRTTEARDSKRGTPQGGVISPLLANLYFRRFVLAWQKFGLTLRFNSAIVNYADDFVICCVPGQGAAAMTAMRKIMDRLGLTVNEQKTRLVNVGEEPFDFLGYTIGRNYGRGGMPYLGTSPSKKAISKLLKRIHDETSTRWLLTSPEKRVEELNPILRGWCGYFNQGPVLQAYRVIQRYTERRLRRWLMKKHKRRGTGYRQYPDAYLYEVLGLFKPPMKRIGRASANV